jgi:hypothetical protein
VGNLIQYVNKYFQISRIGYIFKVQHCAMSFKSFCLLALGLLLSSGLISQVNLSSSNLPIIVISTNGQVILDDPKIDAEMGIIFNGNGQRNQLTDPFNHYSGKIGIEIRGQSSQMFPMKSYSLELRKANGSSNDQSLFGMPKESDWVLYAPYTDKTLMRNFLAYTMSRELGQWAANCRFVEVMLNGQYIGIYVFMERIKRNKGRVNIPKMEKTDVSGDAVTGGYIFSLDKEPNGWFSKYSPPNAIGQTKPQFSYVYPKPDDINDAQKEYIKSYVDSFENALNSATFQDPAAGVRKFADLNSFMDFFIVNEVSRNVDGYRLSSYFHKDRNSTNRKIFAGPVWDFDLAFRNADYCSGSNINGWAFRFNDVCPGDGAGLVPFWWNRLMEDTAYSASLRCRWNNVRQGSVSNQRLMALVDSVSQLLDEAKTRHFAQWPILGQYVWPNPQPIPTSYAGEIEALKSWLNFRLDWIDQNLPNKGICGDPTPDIEGSFSFAGTENPFRSQSRLKISSKSSQVLTIQAVDVAGRKQFARKVPVQTGEQYYDLNAGGWPSGIYFVQGFNDQGEMHTVRLLKVR